MSNFLIISPSFICIKLAQGLIDLEIGFKWISEHMATEQAGDENRDRTVILLD